MARYLPQGVSIDRGSSLESSSGRVELTFQPDGNLVLEHDGDPVWDLWSLTGQVDAQSLRVEVGGALSLVDATGKTGWTVTAPNPYPRELVLRDDGQLVFQALIPLWATNTVDEDAGEGGDPAVLVAGESLRPNDSLRVGAYEVSVATSGQLEVRHSGSRVWSSQIPSPSTGSYLTVAMPTWPAAMPVAGACVKSVAGVPTWVAPIPLNEHVRSSDRIELRLQADGNLVLYACQELWRAAGVGPLALRRLGATLRGAVADATLSDGSLAISSLTPLTDEDGRPISGERPLVLVVCTAELLQPVNNLPTLNAALGTYRDDLVADGFDARVLSANLYRGPLHEDGRIVLALRKALEAVAMEYAQLQGVVLVGSFPEATIVRRWLWETQFEDPVVVPGTPKGQRYVQCWPEPVANWSDNVLADLTGRWDELYRPTVRLSAFKGIAKTAPTYVDGEVIEFKRGNYLNPSIAFTDVFVVIEDQLDVEVNGGTGVATLTCRTQRHNPEVFEPGQVQANPVARPDISISRIDACGAAYSVDPGRIDSSGRGYVDANGTPQVVTDDIDPAPPTRADQLIPDAALERRLLVEYFARNHLHRTRDWGEIAADDRVVSVSSVDFTGQAAVHAQDLAGVIGTTQDPVVSAGADLDAYARAWDLPAAVRAVHAHSSGVNSAFPGKYNELVLEQYVGTPMYRWHHDVAAGTYAPGIKGQGEYADFWLHRSLWQARPTVTSASFLVHYGCDTPNSDGTSVHPYTHPLFAPCRLASCLVFYTDVLLMIGRTKVYMDAPVSFLQPLHGGSTAGEAWLRLYDEAANNAQLADFPHWADAKIAYSWALLGDWTLRRRY